jgi:hypothetical protein
MLKAVREIELQNIVGGQNTQQPSHLKNQKQPARWEMKNQELQKPSSYELARLEAKTRGSSSRKELFTWYRAV